MESLKEAQNKVEKSLFDIKAKLKVLKEMFTEYKLDSWRTIEDFPNYEINRDGKIRHIKKKTLLTPTNDSRQYYRVKLCINGKESTQKLHRLIAKTFISNPNNLECVDHINNNTTDNRIENLRWCNRIQNGQNRKLNKNNTTGTKGVTYKKDRCKYQARIEINGKRVTIGHYETLEEAIEARQKRAKIEFGEFLNSCEKL